MVEHTCSSCQLPIVEGSVVSMRVLDVDRHEFRVIGTCRGSELKQPHVDTSIGNGQMTGVSQQQDRACAYLKRRIAHPLFKNGTLEQVPPSPHLGEQL